MSEAPEPTTPQKEPKPPTQQVQRPSSQELAERPSPQTMFMKHPFFWAAIFGLIMIPLMRPLLSRLMRRIPPPPPVYGKLNSFQLVNQDGKKVTLKNLKGKVYVVSLFFTRCPTICPKITVAMKKLQDRYKRKKLKIEMLSITVDPEYDTPARLKKYALKYGADFSSWQFLSGKQSEVDRLARMEFKTALVRPKKPSSQPTSQKAESLMDITHTGKLLLLDQQGQLRGYFSITEKGRDELFHRSTHVLWERFNPSKRLVLRKVSPSPQMPLKRTNP